ncbi:MAG: hypothetical protein IJ232_09770 [Lachnospiraceae bacterium]|nr:hypothetical protein [Lachnospiraceae bacterium]
MKNNTKKRIVLIICYILNMILPILLLTYVKSKDKYMDEYGYKNSNDSFILAIVLLIGYVLIKRYCKKVGKSRYLYEPFFLLVVVGLGSCVETIESKLAGFVVLMILFLKITTLILETKTYNSKKDERQQRRIDHYEWKLDKDIQEATFKVETAYTHEEERTAQMNLERAKLRKEQYYRYKQ